MSPLVTGFALILTGAVAGGVFAAPLRRRRAYSLELMWGMAFLLGYLLLPHGIALAFLPGWDTALRTVGLTGLAPSILFGLGWGVASLLFAHAIALVGVSLGFAVIMGINTAVGSSLPLMRHWSAVPPRASATVLAGIGLCLAGVALCGRAGILRDGADAEPGPRRPALGLVLCVLSGVLSACANLGFEFGAPVAQAFGPQVPPVIASLGRWLPVYWGGVSVVVLFCIARTTRRREWGLLTAPGSSRDLAWTLVVGVLLALGQIPYGMGAHLLGRLGTSVGWAVCMAASMLVANLTGIWAGEWRSAPAASRQWLWAGLTTVVVAMALLAAGAA